MTLPADGGAHKHAEKEHGSPQKRDSKPLLLRPACASCYWLLSILSMASGRANLVLGRSYLLRGASGFAIPDEAREQNRHKTNRVHEALLIRNAAKQAETCRLRSPHGRDYCSIALARDGREHVHPANNKWSSCVGRLGWPNGQRFRAGVRRTRWDPRLGDDSD